MINEKYFIDNIKTYNDRQLITFHLVNKFGNHKTKYQFCKDETDIEQHKEEFIQAGYIILKTEIQH